MSLQQGLTTGGAIRKPPSGKPDRKLGTPHFVELLGTTTESYYIDKTGLVEAFIRCNRNRVLVTAPHRFGKTINLDMLYNFFILQVEIGKGKSLSEEDFEKKVKETKNYKLFHEHELYITMRNDIMKKHFGRYPVLRISFKCEEPIESDFDAIEFCNKVIVSAFIEHEYLETSLNDREKKLFRKWTEHDWGMRDKTNIFEGVKILIMYMYKHFGRIVVLLIDEYDSVITQAMLHVKEANDLNFIVTSCVSIIKYAIEENSGQNWIEYAFITGVTNIPGVRMSCSNVQLFEFMGNHSFVPFYGLTVEEVNGLLKTTYSLSDATIVIGKPKKKYTRYYSQSGISMYNTWSVLKYAGAPNEDGSTMSLIGVKEAFRFPIIKEIIQTILLQDQIMFTDFDPTSKTDEDILDLVSVIRKVDFCKYNYPRSDLFFLFALEQGYLSSAVKNSMELVIPNEQMKEEFRKQIRDFETEVFGTNQTINICRDFLRKVSEEKCEDIDFKRFHENFEKYLQQYATIWSNQTEENMRSAMSMLFCGLGFTVTCQTGYNQQHIDLEACKDTLIIFAEFHYERSSKDAIHSINYRCSQDAFRLLFAYNLLLIGVNMDANNKVSIGFQHTKIHDDVIYFP